MHPNQGDSSAEDVDFPIIISRLIWWFYENFRRHEAVSSLGKLRAILSGITSNSKVDKIVFKLIAKHDVRRLYVVMDTALSFQFFEFVQ